MRVMRRACSHAPGSSISRTAPTPFDDVWSVTGEFPMALGVRVPRNMTIVREGDRLVLVSSVRLTPLMGFRGPVIGGPWAKRQGPSVHDDFTRLLEQPFKHLLTGHGTPLRDRARDELPAAMKRRFKR